MVCQTVWPAVLPPPLTFYERVIAYFPDWMSIDYGEEVTIVENFTYTGGDFIELSNKPVTTIFQVDVLSGGGHTPHTENKLYTTGDTRTDIDTPDINNVAHVKGYKNNNWYTFIKQHDYTNDVDGIIWTVGGDKPDNGTNVQIQYISAFETGTYINGEHYTLWNNNLLWLNDDVKPDSGTRLKITYYQLISNKIISGFIKAITGEYEEFVCNLRLIQESHWVDTAIGIDLDLIGRLLNTPRIFGETDSIYRARLKGIVSSFVGGGTVQAVKNSVEIITGVEPEVHDGQYTNPDGFVETLTDGETILYRQTETYTKLTQSTITDFVSITGTYLGSPFTFVKGTDYDLYSSTNVRWRYKAGLEPTGKIPDNLTNITITYEYTSADYDPATMRIDVKQADMGGITTTMLFNAIDNSKAAGVLYILNIDLQFSDIVNVSEDLFTASPDIDQTLGDISITAENLTMAVTFTYPLTDDYLIWDVGKWDEKLWAPDVGDSDIVTVSEDVTITIGP